MREKKSFKYVDETVTKQLILLNSKQLTKPRWIVRETRTRTKHLGRSCGVLGFTVCMTKFKSTCSTAM